MNLPFRLTHNTKLLENSQTLQLYGIFPGSTLQASYQLKGGLDEDTVESLLSDHKASIDRLWVLVSAAMIFLMQAGFSLVEAGSVRRKSNSNILIKNLFDACIGAIGWFLFGYGFAYGEDAGGFIGGKNFAGSDLEGEENAYYLEWVFTFTFCATAATIVSGSLAERTYIETYQIYSAFMSCFIYPIVAHWTWHSNGWLYTNDYIDFAGSGAVHLVGGASGFIGAFILKPRYDYYGTLASGIQELAERRPKIREIMENDEKLTELTRPIFQQVDPNFEGKFRRADLGNQIQQLSVDLNTQPVPDDALNRGWDFYTKGNVNDHLTFHNFKDIVKFVFDQTDTAHDNGPQLLKQQNTNLITPALYHTLNNEPDTEKKILELLKNIQNPEEASAIDLAIVGELVHDDKSDFRPNNVQSIVLGTFMLWICWLFFNAGSTAQMAELNDMEPDLIMMNTIIAGSAGGFFSVYLKHPLAGTWDGKQRYDVGALCNGILIGLVSITAGCNNVEPWAALIIGALASVVYGLAIRLMRKLKIDDPVEASAVHGFGGIWGLFVVGLFDRDEGVFYGGGQLGIQIAGIVVITIWAILWSGLYFALLNYFGRLRVPYLYEIVGLDYVEHERSVAKGQ